MIGTEPVDITDNLRKMYDETPQISDGRTMPRSITASCSGLLPSTRSSTGTAALTTRFVTSVR
jgi:hypothetical protein